VHCELKTIPGKKLAILFYFPFQHHKLQFLVQVTFNSFALDGMFECGEGNFNSENFSVIVYVASSMQNNYSHATLLYLQKKKIQGPYCSLIYLKILLYEKHSPK